MVHRLLMLYMRHLIKRYMHFGPAGEHSTPRSNPAKSYLLYVHIPFCESLCPFCSFHRVLLKHDKAERYFSALREEIQRYCDQGFRFTDVYVGGGTPTVLSEELLETLAFVRALFPIQRISVETNPNHLEPGLLAQLKEAGVNRLSVGVQSFDDRLLGEMGRLQPYGSGAEIASRLRESYGVFDTLNVDMIFNLPHQRTASLQRDIEMLTENRLSDQVSFYPLMAARVTTKAMSKEMGPVTFERERRYYLQILEGLQPVYQPATAWCFGRTSGLVDEYIVDHDEYVGVGSGAFSYLDGVFFSSSFSIERYIKHVGDGRTGIVMARPLTDSERQRYRLLIKLFGLTFDAEDLSFGNEASSRLPVGMELALLRLMGVLRKDGTSFHVTAAGMYWCVALMREFLSGVNNFREEMRNHIRLERFHEASVKGSTALRSKAHTAVGVGDAHG